MSHNPNHIISTTTVNHQNSLLINQTYRHDFKNQRSSSEPVHEQNLSNLTINSNTNSSNSTNSTNDSGVIEDDIKNNGFIDCLQNISAIKVRKLFCYNFFLGF